MEISIFVLTLYVMRREQDRVQSAVIIPVHDLVFAIDELGQGHLDAPIPAGGPDELRLISDQLRTMAKALLAERAQLQQHAQQLGDARAAAEQASNAKSDFLSRVSHELRTPLTAILGFAELLESDSLNAAQREFTGTIIKAGNHLLELINDVLDVSRIESGQLTLTVEPLDPRSVVAEAIDVMRPLATAKSITLVAEKPSTKDFVQADGQRLKQVLLNLLSNAIKFSDGATTVTTSISASGESEVAIAVTDHGGGISDSDRDRLFAPFERLNAAERGVEGTGLGLTLCRSLAEAMKGSLTIESAVGEGSRFAVNLQRAPSRPAPATKSVGHSGPAVRNTPRYDSEKHVLYIEDTDSNIRLVAEILAQRPDISLATAIDGRRGIDAATESPPDLILLDLHLPDMDGGEVLEELRAVTSLAEVPVVMLSADATQRQIDRLLELGAHAYLTKPIRVRTLLTAVDQLFGAAEPADVRRS